MVIIPLRLQNKDFRFVLIPIKKKAPCEVQWQIRNNYYFNHSKILSHNGNIGIVCGKGNVVVLDIDNPNFVDKYDKLINTFTTKTGSGGRHYYFICKEPFAKHYYILGEKAGELRVSNSQVLIANCIHPNGNKYEVYNDKEIQLITKEELRKLLGDLLNKKNIQTDTSRSGIEWGEVCYMVQAGYNFEDCDKEMRLFGHEKWFNEGNDYRLGTYCNALKRVYGLC